MIHTNATQYVILLIQRSTTMWTKPEAVEMRYGFEITMYVMNR